MKKEEIEEVVRQSFKVARKIFHKILIDFHPGDLGEFRSEVRKLRSFLHLISMEFMPGNPVKLPNNLKTVYGYAGIIRNLLAHEKRIRVYCSNEGKEMPVRYLEKLMHEIQIWETNTKAFLDAGNDFLPEEDKLMEELPGKLTKESIKKFIQNILFELDSLFSRAHDDEVLHNFRRKLQDLFYNWSYLEIYITGVPRAMSLDHERDYLIRVLNDFRDVCADITLVQTYCDESWNGAEKKLLMGLKKVWESGKNDLRELIYVRLETIMISAGKGIVFSVAE